jgi:pimeloyl-ACP methyl ester carboxylesterase
MAVLIAIPALGCSEELYQEFASSLECLIKLETIIADRDYLSTCAEQVLAQAPDNFIVLGTSFGGRVAIETVLAVPDRVKGLVVIGAGPGPVADPVAGLKRSKRLREGEFEQVVKEMGDMISHLPGPRGPLTRDAFIAMAHEFGAERMARQSDALAHRTDLWPRVHEITCPALMLWGKHDQFSPASDGLKLAAALPNARYVEIAECGHFPSLEAPEETVDAIGHWLAASGLADDKTERM